MKEDQEINQGELEEINPSMNGFNEESTQEITETQTQNEEIVELSKDIQKPKKPRSEKQIAALKKAQETRKRNAELRKQQKEEMKKTIKENTEKPSILKKESVKPTRRPRKQKVIYEDYESDPSSDEEIIVVKKRGRKKRKPKKKIVYEESSSSEDEVYKKPQKKKTYAESSESESDYEYDKVEYSYPVNRPLKYSDVFRFQ